MFFKEGWADSVCHNLAQSGPRFVARQKLRTFAFRLSPVAFRSLDHPSILFTVDVSVVMGVAGLHLVISLHFIMTFV